MAYKSRFLYVDDNGDYTEGMDGGVFITNIQPSGTGVVDITWKSGVIGKQIVESVDTDTELLVVTVEWDGIAYDWNGEVSVNGQVITNGQAISSDSRRFYGSVNIDLNGSDSIIALQDTGTGTKVPVTLQGVGPSITQAIFINGYPGSQTEVKANDTFDVEITFDGSGSEPVSVQVDNYGAAKSGNYPITWDANHKATITITIDSTSNSVQDLAARLSAKNSFGTYGSKVQTDDGGSVDGTNTVKCNDLHPSITFGSITYSSGLDALKNSETADVSVTTSNLDSISYTSPNSELSISNPSTIENTKTVTRVAGDYNVTTANLQAHAIRTNNDAHTTVTTVVYIANILPTVVVTENSSRFQKDPNGKNYTVTLSSNQRLRTLPTLTAPEGTLSSITGSIPGSNFTATITVYDTNTNGLYTWQSLTAENLAGLTQTTIDTNGSNDDTYIIGGFTERDIYFDPQAAEASLGTHVSDTSKLVAVDKDLIAMTFYGDLDDHSRGYSITEPSNTINPTGNILYWNDVMERENNTTGLSFIRIREDV
jgi:hypothetical protein